MIIKARFDIMPNEAKRIMSRIVSKWLHRVMSEGALTLTNPALNKWASRGKLMRIAYQY